MRRGIEVEPSTSKILFSLEKLQENYVVSNSTMSSSVTESAHSRAMRINHESYQIEYLKSREKEHSESQETENSKRRETEHSKSQETEYLKSRARQLCWLFA